VTLRCLSAARARVPEDDRSLRARRRRERDVSGEGVARGCDRQRQRDQRSEHERRRMRDLRRHVSGDQQRPGREADDVQRSAAHQAIPSRAQPEHEQREPDGAARKIFDRRQRREHERSRREPERRDRRHSPRRARRAPGGYRIS
jgi:hypothetical protein